MWHIKGQDRIVDLLQRSINAQNMAHSYLLIGPPHIGKKTLAIDLAQALNCESLDSPCGQCRSCRHIAEENHPDVVFVNLKLSTELSLNHTEGEPTARTKIGIACIEELQRLANLPAYEGKYRVFIFEEAAQLSIPAANRLLKILEEPPAKVVWLLLSSSESLLLPTIVSRCQKLQFNPVKLLEIKEILKAEHGIEESRASLLSRLSQGCPGWAFSAIKDNSLLERRLEDIDMISSLVSSGIEERFAFAGKIAGEISKDRQVAQRYLGIACSWWRDLMHVKGNCQEAVINVDYLTVLEEQAKCISLTDIKDFIINLYSTEEQISRNVNTRLAFESLMLNMPRIQVSTK